MKWKQFFTPVKSIDAAGAKSAMAESDFGAFTLLDVRQPHEYEKEHIPGAKLIPLPELTDRLTEIDPAKPVIVYCAVGGRSRVAAQLLAGKGYQDVRNLQGGIAAWFDRKAFGPEEPEGILFDPAADLEAVCLLAYGLEEGLHEFYETLGRQIGQEDMAALFTRLAAYEKAHKQRIFSFCRDHSVGPSGHEDYEDLVETTMTEGGLATEELLHRNRRALNTVQDVINFAMMIETQALDLYLRFADKSRNEDARKFFHDMAEEEKRHLRSLGELSQPEAVTAPAFDRT